MLEMGDVWDWFCGEVIEYGDVVVGGIEVVGEVGVDEVGIFGNEYF